MTATRKSPAAFPRIKRSLHKKRKLFLGSRAPLAAAVTAPRAMVSANHASGVKMEIASSRQTFKHSLYLRWKVDQRDFVTFSWFQWTLCSCHWGGGDWGVTLARSRTLLRSFHVELKRTKEWRCRTESLSRSAWTLVVHYVTHQDRIQNRTIFPVLNFLVLFMISGPLKKIKYFANLRQVKINRTCFSLIVIARQLIF